MTNGRGEDVGRDHAAHAADSDEHADLGRPLGSSSDVVGRETDDSREGGVGSCSGKESTKVPDSRSTRGSEKGRVDELRALNRREKRNKRTRIRRG
jgi:hypothetical protein